MTPGNASDPLLTEVRIGSVTVKNRIVSTAHGAFVDWYDPEASGQRYIEYQRRRAEGGVGLIIAQSIVVNGAFHKYAAPGWDPDAAGQHEFLLSRSQRLTTAVHRFGAKAFLQLMHPGAQFRSDADPDLRPLWSLNGGVSSAGEISHRMSGAEIERVVECYAEAADLARRAGYDGVELHGTHGYLIQQSYSPWGNGREDEWGQPLALLQAIVRAIRSRVGAEFVVGLRMTTDDFRAAEDGSLGERYADLAGEIATARLVDYFSHSEGSRYSDYARSIGGYRHPHGEFLPLTRRLKQAAGDVPVIGVGRVTTPDLARSAILDGTCDLVAMTRGHIADPDIVRKLAAGEPERIRPCVGANQGCQDRMGAGLAISCFHNPDVGREGLLAPLSVEPTRRVVIVVGAGPAGCKAAEIAARRGHRVTLLERDAQLGGMLRRVAAVPHADELLGSIRWLETELRELGVQVELQAAATAAGIMTREPDVVVVATGVQFPDLPERLGAAAGDGSVPLYYAEAVLSDPLATGRYLVVDHLGGFEAAFAAEHLRRAGHEVVVISSAPTVGAHIGSTGHTELQPRLWGLGCDVRPSTELVGIADGTALLRHQYGGRGDTVDVAGIVLDLRGQPDDSLVTELAPFVRTLTAGDVVAPRTALHAFRDGDRAGRLV